MLNYYILIPYAIYLYAKVCSYIGNTIFRNGSHFFTFIQTLTNLVSIDRCSRAEYFDQGIFENHQNWKEIKEEENFLLFYFYIYEGKKYATRIPYLG